MDSVLTSVMAVEKGKEGFKSEVSNSHVYKSVSKVDKRYKLGGAFGKPRRPFLSSNCRLARVLSLCKKFEQENPEIQNCMFICSF